MKPWFRAAMVIAVLAPVAGCSFYFGDDSGDDVCPAADQAVPFLGYRNPANGQCESGGGGTCGAPSDSLDGAAEQLPDWALCDSGCETLAEVDCLAAAECRGIYTQSAVDDGREFGVCWGIAPSGPATGEDCVGLDAYSCSRHNDCLAIYDVVPSADDDGPSGLQFASCEPEPVLAGCYSDAECPDGYDCTADTECLPPPDCDGEGCEPVCYGRCVPAEATCDAVDCGLGSHCEEQCEPCIDDLDGDGLCEPSCNPVCVPDDGSCAAIDCGPGYECQEICYECDPDSPAGCDDGPSCEPQCVPIEPASCDAIDCGAGAHCELQCYPDPTPTDPDDPSVPPGPPTMDECYPVCIPDGSSCDLILCDVGTHCEEQCVVECTPDGECAPPVCSGTCVPDGPTATCESLATEAACTARADCVAVYTGDDCTCYPWGCVCEELAYERCETGSVDDPATGVSTPAPRVLARQ